MEVPDSPKEMKWKCADTFSFINLIRPHCCLWDTRHTDYCNQSARTAAMNSVLRRLELPWVNEKEALRKLNLIRKLYHKELFKLLMNDGYKPRVFWFKAADVYMRDAALKPEWISIPRSAISEGAKYSGPGPDLTQFALESYSTYSELDGPRQRLYRQACTMILNELLEEQENKQ